jgi:beta-galactosidase
MKIGPFIYALLAAASLTFPLHGLAAVTPTREHILLDANWKFHLGDDWPNALDLAKAGASHGPAAMRFNDDSWRTINLPHDWVIELPFDKTADLSHGFKPVGPGFPENSIGWYRRTFELPKMDAGKRVWLTFDGVFRDATVWVNGWYVTHHESGYYPFREDITDVVKFGDKNLITVRVDASKFEGWFYEGAGIYRHVWLDETAPLAIAPDGVFVYSHFKNNIPVGNPRINVQTTLINTLTNNQDATVSCKVLSPDGKLVARFKQSGEIPGAGQRCLQLHSEIASPALWSPESPNLYKLVTTVKADGKVVDQNETTFGIRTVAFDPIKGFLLNGKHYELKGTCNHQDMAGVGEALPDALQYFRIEKLKEFGCNAYRTSHNPPTPELLDACDKLGMIVMDENRLLGSDAQNLKRLAQLVRRDRNHPSVSIWSIGNEEWHVQNTSAGGRVGSTMQNLVIKLDPTRPVTAAENIGNVYNGLMSALEVRGWNYDVGTNMDNYHTEHPNQPNVGTEQGSTVSTRGIYENDKVRGYVSAYDINFPKWATTAERWWSYFDARPWLSGGFVWTGFDYRGEPTPYSWPCINSHFGILDTCGFPKDLFYYYKSWWTTNTVLHLLPHWNWPGKEGTKISVWCFSNCKQVELFLNGVSLGRKVMKKDSHLEWEVKYEPGILRATGYDASGEIIAETKEETTGDPVAIHLKSNRSSIKADGEDVAVFTIYATDARGREVPTAQNLIHFKLNGAGKILGVGNGDPSCHEPDKLVQKIPIHNIALNTWRWKMAELPAGSEEATSEYNPNFDDSAWKIASLKSDGTSFMPLQPNQTAIYRTHVKLAENDLEGINLRIHFSCIDDDGRIFVNGHFVGKSTGWSERPVFDLKKVLHVGDNVIAVGVKNDGGTGGMSPDVNLEIIEKPQLPPPWTRSLFNGLAEIIVQSTTNTGEIHLSATADGLKPAAARIQTISCPPPPSLP